MNRSNNTNMSRRSSLAGITTRDLTTVRGGSPFTRPAEISTTGVGKPKKKSS